MRLTRQHFQLVAEPLRRCRPPNWGGGSALPAWRSVVRELADVLATTNPAFSRGTFFEACGMNIREEPAAGQRAAHRPTITEADVERAEILDRAAAQRREAVRLANLPLNRPQTATEVAQREFHLLPLSELIRVHHADEPVGDAIDMVRSPPWVRRNIPLDTGALDAVHNAPGTVPDMNPHEAGEPPLSARMPDVDVRQNYWGPLQPGTIGEEDIARNKELPIDEL